MNIFKKFRAMLRLNEAIRRADNAHKESGERYYVMPSGKKGNLIIMDRANFRKLKHKKYINRTAFVGDLERECFYCTPYRNGTGQLSPEAVAIKRKQYYSWIDSLRNG